MPTYNDYDSQTSTYSPGLQFDGINGLTIGGVTTHSFFIPMILATASLPTYTKSFNTQNVIPIYDMRYGIAYGGSFVSPQGTEFPKIRLEGSIDTDLTSATEAAPYAGEQVAIPIVAVNSIPMHWIEVLKMFFEGRYLGNQRYDPSWYRDPFGRVYNFPRIHDLTAAYIAGVPERANFTMVLLLNHSYQ